MTNYDWDNLIIEKIYEVLIYIDENEDNYLTVKDRTKIYRLKYLVEEYRNWYNTSYQELKWKKEEWNSLKDKQYNEMFKLLKYLLPKLII